jgi:hypothetical protein
MRRLVAVVVLGALLVGTVVAPADAGGAAYDALLAFGAFTLFTNLLLAPFFVRPLYVAPSPVAYASPPAVYAGVTPTYAAPATTHAPTFSARVLVQREVVVPPHGRYVLRGDGVTVAYQWIWVPSPPAGAAPPPPPR